MGSSSRPTPPPPSPAAAGRRAGLAASTPTGASSIRAFRQPAPPPGQTKRRRRFCAELLAGDGQPCPCPAGSPRRPAACHRSTARCRGDPPCPRRGGDGANGAADNPVVLAEDSRAVDRQLPAGRRCRWPSRSSASPSPRPLLPALPASSSSPALVAAACRMLSPAGGTSAGFVPLQKTVDGA